LYDARFNGGEHASPRDSRVAANGVFGVRREDEQILSFGDLLRTMWRRLWIILLVPLVLVGLSVGYTSSQTPIYQASATMLIGQESVDNPASEAGNELQDLQWFMPTLAAAANTRPVAEDVVQRLGLSVPPEYVQGSMGVEQIPDTQLLVVSFRDPSPERAQLIANTIGDALSERLPELGPNSSGSITATVWEQAALPYSPVSPDLMRNVLVALALGLMLGIGLAFLVDYLDDRWRSVNEVEQFSRVPTFGVVPEFGARRKKRDRLTRRQDPPGSHLQE
jgi:capsular polysaccharide biosynthesis protein